MKTTWKDADGREWNAAIGLPVAQRIKQQADLDIFDAKEIGELVTDPLAVVNVLASVHHSELQKRELTVEQFMDVCTGEGGVYKRAQQALVAGLSDFLKKFGQETLANFLTESLEASDRAEKELSRQLDGKADAIFDQAIQKASEQIEQALKS